MRLLKIFGSPLLLVAGVILLAPGAGFAQNTYSQYYNCTYLNSYTQFCEYVLGSSNMSIDSSGNITVNAQTDADWGVIINPGQCQNLSEGNPYACQAPNLPGPGASVYSVVNPGGASSSASGTGGADLTPALTAQASQAGTYTETSYHYASFDNGLGYNTINLQTQQSQSYAPAPTITSISPDQWPVGTSTGVTIYGSNLPASPSVSFAYSGGGTDSYISWSQGNATSSQITGSVTVDPSDPGGEGVTVTVTGGGSGNNFGGSGQSGGSGSASGNASVGNQPPSITYNGNVVSGSQNPTQVVVGQQISLTGSPAGGTWSVGGTNWGQYKNWPSAGPTQTDLSKNPVQFFWAAGENANVTYTVNNVAVSASFTIAAPSWQASAVVPAAATVQQGGTYLGAVYNPSATVTSPSGFPGGTTTFVQIVQGGTMALTVSSGSFGCSSKTPCTVTCPLIGTPPLLDTSAPYPFVTPSANGSGASLYDDPGGNLSVPPPAGEIGLQESGSFTSYAFWTPSVSGTAFPVPLAAYTWSWSRAVTWSGGSWSLSGAPLSNGQAQASTTYPTWGAVSKGFQSSCPIQQGH